MSLLAIMQRKEDWSSASVVNHTIVTNPIIWQPGFDLPHNTWPLMNRFCTGQGTCRANLHKRGLTQSLSCDCGQRQTTNHTVDTLTKFEGGLNLLHMAGIYSDSTTCKIINNYKQAAFMCLQCFDAVGWAAGRAFGL